MKRLFIYTIAISLLFFGCDLVRDNPLDENYNLDEKDKVETKELKFDNYSVACKYSKGAVTYSTDDIVNVGDEIYLRVEMKNTGNVKLDGVRATITSSSSLIQIKALTSSDKYIKITQSTTDDFIDVSKIGWGVITDGNSYSSAPNYSDYGIEFTVADGTTKGSKIIFTIKATDSSGDEWQEDFEVLIE